MTMFLHRRLMLIGEGFRVPTLVVSPWAKHGFIDHTQYEFASLLRLAEDNFNLPLLGTRDVKANNMMNSFDFGQFPLQPLVEPANFVGPANPSTTTQLMTSSLTTNQIIARTGVSASPVFQWKRLLWGFHSDCFSFW